MRGRSDNEGVELKHLLALAVVVLALIGQVVLAQGVRPATEEEIADLLAGCWHQEATLREYEWSLDYRWTVYCFGTDGGYHWTGFGYQHGVGGDGVYWAEDDRLNFYPDKDHQGYQQPAYSCDLVVQPGVAMKLSNCISSEGNRVANRSYSKLKGNTWEDAYDEWRERPR